MIEDLADTWPVWSAGVLGLLAFLTTVSEKTQNLLGPMGKWFRERRQRAVENQRDFAELLTERHGAQVDSLLDEVELYRARYSALIADMEQLQEENRRLARRVAELERKVVDDG